MRRWATAVAATTALSLLLPVTAEAAPKSERDETQVGSGKVVERGKKTKEPTPEPTPEPTTEPTTEPTEEPTAAPSEEPTPVHDVRVEVGDDLAGIAAAHPAGTTFLLASGVHRLASVTPESGDVFVGESGAVLSGARDLSDAAWTTTTTGWWVGGQSQSSAPTGVLEAGANPQDAHGEELFVDDQRWEHVASPTDLRPGTWHLDTTADRIWLGSDPATLGTIEASVAEFAIAGGPGIDDVTVRNLVVEKYANRASRGAIDAVNSANWTILDVTARHNHGAGISLGPGALLEGSQVHHNGQIGVKGVGTFRQGPRTGESLHVVVRANEISHNRTLGYKWAWEGGATKFAEHAAGILFEDNWVHHNFGPGPWFDVYNHDAVIRSNLVEDNTVRGIFYEISHGAQIHWNIVRRNGNGDLPVLNEAGIFISNSPDVTVWGNLVEDNTSGIVARSAGDRSPTLSNLLVRDNDIRVTVGRNGLNIDAGETADAYTSRNNRFEGNTYRLDGTGERRFHWGDDRAKTWGDWVGYGLDVDGVVLGADTQGSLPADAVAFTPREYGAS